MRGSLRWSARDCHRLLRASRLILSSALCCKLLLLLVMIRPMCHLLPTYLKLHGELPIQVGRTCPVIHCRRFACWVEGGVDERRISFNVVQCLPHSAGSNESLISHELHKMSNVPRLIYAYNVQLILLLSNDAEVIVPKKDTELMLLVPCEWALRE